MRSFRKPSRCSLSIALTAIAFTCLVFPGLTAYRSHVHAEKPLKAEVSTTHSKTGYVRRDPQFTGSAVMAVSDSGVWTTTGSMLVARRDHTATLLTDGRVLIVGWLTPIAELYDPVTGTFRPTGNTLRSHGQDATATRLLDGRVLIAGGTQASTFGEIYDPATETFSATGNLNASHGGHTATLLKDGRVLIAGGTDFSSVITTAVAELYDPATGTFSLTGSLNTDRDTSSSALLHDGRVLIAGGAVSTTPGNAVCTDTAELYDPTSGIFNRTGNMTEPRCNLLSGQGLVLKNGEALIVGGLGNQSADLFDSTTEKFRATGSMVLRQFSPTSILLANGQVLVTGGFSAIGPVTTNSAELYDPTTETFALTASMSAARQEHTATLLLNGQVLVTGGGFGSGNELSSAEIFTPLNRPPVAKCQNITVRTGDSCMAALATSDVDDGSFDPDGDTITLALDSTGPFGTGQHNVTLTATDSHGASSSCTATATIICPPIITSAFKDHKNLIVTGERFDGGSVILLNGEAQKTKHDDQNPNTLIGKKAGKKIDSGQTVTLQVRNSNGTLSQEFSFTRP